MANGKDDIRVRLRPEGEQAVIAAFRKIEREAGGTAKAISASLASIGRLLPALSAGAAVAGFVALLNRTVELGDQLAKMSQRFGESAQFLSELGFAGQLADVPLQAIGESLKKLSVNMAETARGTGDARTAFQALGISVTNADGTLKSSQQVLFEIADQFAKMQDGAGKVAIAVKLFGRSGEQLIPLLNQGAKGLRDNAEEARRLGITYSDELSAKAEELNDNLTRLKAAFEGLGRSIVDPAIPAVNEFVRSIVLAAQQVGILRGLLGRGVLSGADVANAAVELGEVVRKLEEVRRLRADFEKMGPFKRFFSADDIGILNAQVKALEARKAALEGVLQAQGEAQPDNFERMGVVKSPAPGLPDPDAGRKAIAAGQARIAAQRAALDNELRLFQAHNKLLESEDRAAFDRGLLTLKEFHTRRLALLTAELDKEIEILQRKRDLTAKTPTKDAADAERLKQELAAIDNQIEVARVNRQRAAGEANATEAKAIADLAQKRLSMDIRLLESQGRRTEAAQEGLKQEIRHWEELLRLQGASESEIAAKTAEVRATGERNIGFEDLRSQADAALRDIARRREEINQQVQRGQLLSFQGEAQIIELERQRLPILQGIADKMLQLAGTDPFKIQEARDFAAALGQIHVNVDEAGRKMAQFQEQAFSSLVDNTTDFFARGITEAESFGDAIKSLALNVFQDLRQMAARELSNQIWKGIFSLFGGAAGAAAGGIGAGTAGSLAATSSVATAGGGFVPVLADGGLITGPGTSTSDSIPARLSTGEFVVSAKAVRHWGSDLLASMNAMRGVTVAPIRRGIPSFADGGLVEGVAAGAGAELSGRLEVVAGEGSFVRWLRSPNGQREVVRLIQSNKRGVRSGLGI
jgi:hypothetical protein